MYRKIEVSGFRGVDKIVLDNLGPLNILTGKNNTGKSSCLEAISLLSSGSLGFKNALGEDSLTQVLGRRVRRNTGLEYMQHVGADETRITGYKEGESDASNLVMAKSVYDVHPPIDTSLIGRLESRIRSALRPDEFIKNQMFFYFYDKNRSLGALYSTESGLHGVAEEQGGAPGRSQSLFADLSDLSPNIHDRLADSQKLYDVIPRLREKMPGITDIRQIHDMLHVCMGRTVIPFYLTGDGFQASLMITVMVHALGRGILVLEEPENHMHPGLLIQTVDELLSACKNRDMQVFLSSHSDELIKCALELQTDVDVCVYNMCRLDDEMFVESFDQHESKERRLNMQLDLRGL